MEIAEAQLDWISMQRGANAAPLGGRIIVPVIMGRRLSRHSFQKVRVQW
jgi:hypothetical protein